MHRRILMGMAFMLFMSSLFAEVSALVKVETLQEKMLPETLTVYGVLQTNAPGSVTISLPVGGQVPKVWVSAGQIVKKGAPLFDFIPDPNARFNFEQASSSFVFAKNELKRIERLFAEQLATRSQVDAAKKAFDDAQASVESTALIGSGDMMLKKISAPFAGIITQLNIAPGNRIQAGATLIQLGRCDNLVAQLGADPADAFRIQIGMAAKIQFFSNSDKMINASISQVGHQLNPQSHMVDVWASLGGYSCEKILPGMPVEAHIILSTSKRWVVLQSAVLKDDAGYYIYRLHANHAERINVVPITINQAWMGVQSNQLRANDLIVIQGNYELTNGMLVRIEKS